MATGNVPNFNNTNPPAPPGSVNVQWQAVYNGVDPINGLPIRNISAYVPVTGAGSTHDEPLTDGNANFIFAATLSLGGDVIVCVGVPD